MPRKKCGYGIDHLDMTIAFAWDVKPQTKTSYSSYMTKFVVQHIPRFESNKFDLSQVPTIVSILIYYKLLSGSMLCFQKRVEHFEIFFAQVE